MSAGILMKIVFSVLLLPALLTIPLVITGRGLAKHTSIKPIYTVLFIILAIFMSWGTVAYIMLFPASGTRASWTAWYMRLSPLIMSGIPAGLLWGRMSGRNWLSLVPTASAFLIFAFFIFQYLLGT